MQGEMLICLLILQQAWNIIVGRIKRRRRAAPRLTPIDGFFISFFILSPKSR